MPHPPPPRDFNSWVWLAESQPVQVSSWVWLAKTQRVRGQKERDSHCKMVVAFGWLKVGHSKVYEMNH
jgi:hypothetical protein